MASRGRPKKNDELKDIALSQIKPSPRNPRKTFNKQEHEELIASIRSVGLLQPIVVRPIVNDEFEYEIVYGERRFRATGAIAEQDKIKKPVIRAIIKPMTEEDAFLAGVVENLQRVNISEEEEAASFADFAEKFGENAVEVLAEKIGASQRYVRKRIEIMRLPRPFLKAWKRGVLSYGHLEQLLRVPETKDRLLYLKDIYKRAFTDRPITIAMLKDMIGTKAIALSIARFNIESCHACVRNSATQLTLFGVGEADSKCSGPNCFVSKQTAWFIENWKGSNLNEHKTNGFILNGSSEQFEYMFGLRDPYEKCVACEHYVSLIYLDGKVCNSRICKGPKGCLASQEKAARQIRENGGKPLTEEQQIEQQKEKPRVAWHGEFFRQEFYKTEIPAVLNGVDLETRIKLAFCHLMHANHDVRTWFMDNHGPTGPDISRWAGIDELMPFLADFDGAGIERMMIEALENLIFTDNSFGDNDRQEIAEYIMVDLGKWTITPEYLQKKVKKEILQIISDHKFMLDPAFLLVIKKQHGKAIAEKATDTAIAGMEYLATLKKSQLVDLILNSGADLSGKVPREVLDMPKLRTSSAQIEPEFGEDNDPDAFEGRIDYVQPDPDFKEPRCSRIQLEDDGVWTCENDITSCIHNDGMNVCSHPGKTFHPLEEEPEMDEAV